jgi:uncharacterized damage-inducible protein DinB
MFFITNKPLETDFPHFYEHYISLVPDDDISLLLSQQTETIQATFGNLSDQQSLYAYQEGKWSIREIIGHLSDSERIFAGRVLRIARRDPAPLVSFDENNYAALAEHSKHCINSLLEELLALRKANLLMIKHLNPEWYDLAGTMDTGAPITLRALLFIMAGHVEHHINIFKERYLPHLPV